MKSILTLLFTVAVAAVLNAQTVNTPSQTTPAAPAVSTTPTQAEPQKKIAYEIIPAKRVVTPTNTNANAQPANIEEIKQQEQDKKVQESLEQRNAYMQGGQQPAPQKQTEGTGQPK